MVDFFLTIFPTAILLFPTRARRIQVTKQLLRYRFILWTKYLQHVLQVSLLPEAICLQSSSPFIRVMDIETSTVTVSKVKDQVRVLAESRAEPIWRSACLQDLPSAEVYASPAAHRAVVWSDNTLDFVSTFGLISNAGRMHMGHTQLKWSSCITLCFPAPLQHAKMPWVAQIVEPTSQINIPFRSSELQTSWVTVESFTLNCSLGILYIIKGKKRRYKITRSSRATTAPGPSASSSRCLSSFSSMGGQHRRLSRCAHTVSGTLKSAHTDSLLFRVIDWIP